MLSVPYALHAKTLDGFNGSYSELTGKPDYSKWDKDSTDNVNLTGNQTISGNKKFIGTMSAGDRPITNVGTPQNQTDAANKAYVDELMAQLNTLRNTVNAGGIARDIDGNHYNTVSIGSQVWMAENLKTMHYSNGESIPQIIDNQVWCSCLQVPVAIIIIYPTTPKLMVKYTIFMRLPICEVYVRQDRMSLP